MNKKDIAGKVFITNSFKETQKLGEEFARSLLARLKGETLNALVIALYGDLGSGKTTFVQGLAEGLGIKKRIISPTFIIVRNYRIKNHESHSASSGQARIMNLYHIDLYRVEGERDIEGLGIEEIMNDKNNIVIVEWAEKLKNLIPKNRIEIRFEYLKDHSRKIYFL